MRDKGVLLHRQQRHPLTSHRLLSYRDTVYISIYLGLEAEDCDSYTNYCCYSHGEKHCFCLIIAAKYRLISWLNRKTPKNTMVMIILKNVWFWGKNKPCYCSSHVRQGEGLQHNTKHKISTSWRAESVLTFSRLIVFYWLPWSDWVSYSNTIELLTPCFFVLSNGLARSSQYSIGFCFII